MESNDVGVIFLGWGMSIASKRAKERQNRTPDELVMVKTVKREKLNWQGLGIRGSGRISGTGCPETCMKMRSRSRMSGLMAGCPGLWAGCPGSKSEDELEELDFEGGN